MKRQIIQLVQAEPGVILALCNDGKVLYGSWEGLPCKFSWRSTLPEIPQPEKEEPK